MRFKPLCKKCNQRHWNMIGCNDVPQAEARESAKAEAAIAARVIPEPRTRPARQNVTVVSRNFVQQAPGVYRRRKRGV